MFCSVVFIYVFFFPVVASFFVPKKNGLGSAMFFHMVFQTKVSAFQRTWASSAAMALNWRNSLRTTASIWAPTGTPLTCWRSHFLGVLCKQKMVHVFGCCKFGFLIFVYFCWVVDYFGVHMLACSFSKFCLSVVSGQGFLHCGHSFIDLDVWRTVLPGKSIVFSLCFNHFLHRFNNMFQVSTILFQLISTYVFNMCFNIAST